LKVVLEQQFEIVCGPDRKQTISTCFSEAKNQKFETRLGPIQGLRSIQGFAKNQAAVEQTQRTVPLPYVPKNAFQEIAF
jgi:hypothetical protein